MDAPAETKALADKYISPDGSPAPESAGANRLPVLARDINAAIRAEKAQEHKADDYAKKSEAARKAAMEWRLKIGAYLIEAKALVPHGQWLPWLRDNCALSKRSAQLYMRVAGHKDEIEAEAKCATDGECVAHLSMRQANASIAKPRLVHENPEGDDPQTVTAPPDDGANEDQDRPLTPEENRKLKYWGRLLYEISYGLNRQNVDIEDGKYSVADLLSVVKGVREDHLMQLEGAATFLNKIIEHCRTLPRIEFEPLFDDDV